MSIIQTEVNPSLLNTLYLMLTSITIPKRSKGNNRYNPDGLRLTQFGLVNYKLPKKGCPKRGMSRHGKLYPEILEELKLIMSEIYPDFKYTTVQVNNNCSIGYHTDKNNQGDTVILSLGEYEGGYLVIDEKKYNTNCNAMRFDATRIPHMVTNDIVGTKYSLIYFSIPGFESI
jgi:hypothetical protein